jgi:hypothetical protein
MHATDFVQVAAVVVATAAVMAVVVKVSPCTAARALSISAGS